MPTPLERIDELLTNAERTIRERFEEFIRNINRDDVLQRIIELLESNRIEDALEIVDSYIVSFSNVLPEIQNTVGVAAATELAREIPDTLIAFGFDPSNPRAARLIRSSRLALIAELVPEQRASIRQAIARGFEEGTGTTSIARSFRRAIGLTREQEGWVASYERRIRNLDGRALSMALRDRRHDRSVRRAINGGKPLTERQIQTMTDRYRLRALMYRSDNIARTEALRATSQAREEALQQMIEATGIDPDRVVRIWNATNDRRTRDAHETMDGQTAGVDQPFTDGDGHQLKWPGDPSAPAKTTINCRCAVTFNIKPAS